MKERKIIVNKCDVSGCEFYCRYTDNCLDYKHWYDKPLCKNLPDCHYKQLKAKEQECDELKDLNIRLDNQRETYWKGYQKLKQTLTEIKEIAETAAKCMYATYSDDYTEGYSWLGRIILQTISEVEDANI